MSMTDLRAFSMADLLYYNSKGDLVEDLTEDFLRSAGSGYPPVPAAISEVMSASALVDAAETQALTHVRAANLSDVFVSGLQCKQRNDAAENSSLACNGVQSSGCVARRE